MKNTTDILLVGVGGQGILTMASIIATAAMLDGNDVRMSEIHGMAQRGGTVFTEIRIGSKSSIIPPGRADIMIALEPAEALRYLHKLRRGGLVVINDQPIPPPIVYVQGLKYPETEEIISKIKEVTDNVYLIPATKIAEEKLGDPRPANVILIGFGLAKGFLGISEESVREAIKRVLRKKYVDINLKALEIGKELAHKNQGRTECFSNIPICICSRMRSMALIIGGTSTGKSRCNNLELR